LKFWLIGMILLVGVNPALAQTTSASIIAECTQLLSPNRPIPAGSDAPSIRIVQPASPVVYGSAVTVAIQAENFDVTSEGRHWHLWVNGQLQGMVYQPTAIIDLAPGTYTLCASLGNADHADIGMPSGIQITVEPAKPGIPTPTLPVAREQAQVQPEPTGPTTGQLMLLVGGGLLAAIGGWWLGARLNRRR
jgi:hypothetical protein